MNKYRVVIAITTVLFSQLVVCEPSTPEQALGLRKVDINFRYRMEEVDQSNFAKSALASTLRSRATIEAGKYRGLSTLLEIDDVRIIGSELYNDSLSGKTQYPLVPDPPGTDINQALLHYQTDKDATQLNAGRQRFNQLNQRFIGSAGWRQNEQTFDGYRYQQTLSKRFAVDFAHFTNVNRVFGPTGPKADEHGKFNVVLAQWSLSDDQKIAAFYNNLTFDNWTARDSATSGVDYIGKLNVKKNQLVKLHIALAQQRSNMPTPANFSHSYARIDASWKINRYIIDASAEKLSGDGTTAFQMPLASFAFNGYADKFITTPVNGLDDYCIGARYLLREGELSLQYHQYQSDNNLIHYGDEVDVLITQIVSKKVSLLVKLGNYSAKDFSQDTRRFWLGISYTL